jgi:hypothetical protein
MLTLQDIQKRLGIDEEQAAYLHAIAFLPEPVVVGGRHLFREQDVAKLVKYLKARSKCRARGVDPDSPLGPSIPIYSTAGKPRFDPRLAAANEREAERQKKSRTLRAGSAPIGKQPQVKLPKVVSKTNKVDG